MIVYRLCKSAYSSDLSGSGAKLCGGRWNSVGVSAVYTSESRALCMAEAAVHIPFGIVPTDYQMVSITIPDSISIFELPLNELPDDWNTYPSAISTQKLGDFYLLKKHYFIIKVPSVLVQGDFNFILNPLHQAIKKIEIISVMDFKFDQRLVSVSEFV